MPHPSFTSVSESPGNLDFLLYDWVFSPLATLALSFLPSNLNQFVQEITSLNQFFNVQMTLSKLVKMQIMIQ